MGSEKEKAERARQRKFTDKKEEETSLFRIKLSSKLRGESATVNTLHNSYK